MEAPKGYFSIVILTKPYLKKYLHSLYGIYILFDRKNSFGKTIAAYLEKPFRLGQSAEALSKRTSKYTVAIEIFLPLHFRENYRHYELSDENIININDFIEQDFCEKLFTHVEYGRIYHVEAKKNIEEFCWKHHIDTYDDISLDAIIKKERRYRKKKEEDKVKRAMLENEMLKQ